MGGADELLAMQVTPSPRLPRPSFARAGINYSLPDRTSEMGLAQVSASDFAFDPWRQAIDFTRFKVNVPPLHSEDLTHAQSGTGGQ